MTLNVPAEQFRKRAKALLRAVAARDPQSLARVTAVRRDDAHSLTLMQAQHVLAVEAGYGKWNELIQAPSDRLGEALARIDSKVSSRAHPWARASLIESPWAVEKWTRDFGWRTTLEDELRLLALAFPQQFREWALSAVPPRHPLASDLIWLGSRARLLVLANELRHYLPGELSDSSKIPMEGRLHNPGLYSPTISEILVGPLLRCLNGELIWQPEHDGPGSDYRVNHIGGVLLAEVKRLSRSQRVAEEEARRVQKSMEEQADDEVQQPSRIFSDDEERANTRQDAMRLYPHVRKAARQLETSARKAVGNEWQSVPGILFLDIQGNSYVTNVIPWLERWLTYPWARAIDLVVFFDYRPRDGQWGLIADSFSLSRTDRALRILTSALPQCEHGHFHVPACPPGKCDQPFGF